MQTVRYGFEAAFDVSVNCCSNSNVSPSRVAKISLVTINREALASRPALKCVQSKHMEDPEAQCDGGDVLFTGEVGSVARGGV